MLGGETAISTSKTLYAVKPGLVHLGMGSIASVERRGLWQAADTVTVTNHVPINISLVHLNVQNSNQLLDTLEEWNRELEAHLAVPEPDI